MNLQVFLVEVMGRRVLLFVSLVNTIASLVAMTISISFTPETEDFSIHPLSIVTICSVIGFIVSFGLGMSIFCLYTIKSLQSISTDRKSGKIPKQKFDNFMGKRAQFCEWDKRMQNAWAFPAPNRNNRIHGGAYSLSD